MSEIAEKVKAIIIDKLGVEASEVTPEASFTNDLGADSLDTVELIMEFEKEFNVSIPDDQAENIGTVGQAISYLEEHAKVGGKDLLVSRARGRSPSAAVFRRSLGPEPYRRNSRLPTLRIPAG